MKKEVILLIIFSISLLFFFLRAYRKRKQFCQLISNENKETEKLYKKSLKQYKLEMLFVISSLIILIFLSLSLFQVNDKLGSSSNKSNEIVFLLDLSNSMDAQDLTISRLEAAKLTILNLIDLINSTDLALVCFAAEPQVIVPISEETEFIKQVIPTLETQIIPNQGTNLTLALNTASKCFTNNALSKTIILLTDAENHNPSNLVQILDNIKKNNINIKCIGFGTTNGAKIPTSQNFLKNWQGQEVISKLNLELLKQIDNNYNIYPINLNYYQEYISTKNNTNNLELNHYKNFSKLFITIALILLLFSLYLKNK